MSDFPEVMFVVKLNLPVIETIEERLGLRYHPLQVTVTQFLLGICSLYSSTIDVMVKQCDISYHGKHVMVKFVLFKEAKFKPQSCLYYSTSTFT